MTEFIGVDPDIAVYRIFPLPYFEDALRNRELVLLTPELWPDRFEVLPRRLFVIVDGHPDCGFPLDAYLPPSFAQCWSRSSDSDILMRAYSRVVNARTSKNCTSKWNTCPKEEGVRVRSTPRKLIEVLRAGVPVERECFVGKVEYVEPDAITSHLSHMVIRIVGDAFSHTNDDLREAITCRVTNTFKQPEASARLLLVKRKAFEQEAEVRLLVIGGRDQPGKHLIRIPIDPNDVFEEVSFDARLDSLEREARKKHASALGYTGAFQDSQLCDFSHLYIAVTPPRV
jgi:hypothetical protein